MCIAHAYSVIHTHKLSQTYTVGPCLFELLAPGCVHNSEFSISSNEASNACNLHNIIFQNMNFNHMNPPKH